ncbi:AMP-binding protein [Cumulibacter soli]|uniref:AMP-binding protein n=1 Tax=Cumulibacter soli TaxID=2546344 RepID=UPI0010674D3E|nr:AMP-binding protein [Cumulibacter soli]
MTNDVAQSEQPEWLVEAFARYASERGDFPAVTDATTGESLTWAQLWHRAELVARGMLARGVRIGDLVSIALWNGVDFVVADVATWRVGAVPQPLSQKLAAPEFTAILEVADPALVVGDDALAASFDVEMVSVDRLAEEGASYEGELPVVLSPSLKAPTSGGSTGRPKVILAGGPAALDATTLDVFRIFSDTVSLVSAPMHHNAPHMIMFQTLARGGHAVLMQRFEAEQVLANIEKYRCTMLYVVPIMMHRMWNLPDDVKSSYDISSIATVWHMGAPCPPWLKQHWIEWFGPEPIMELYAGTEGQAMTVIGGADWLSHYGSVGPVVAGEILALDESGAQVPVGAEGELWMRRTEDRDETYRYLGADAKQLDRGDGLVWESLGDIGHFDADGFLYLHDRKTDMILIGGVNVFPAEIEAALEAYPAISSSAVIGLPDEEYGNRIHAIVQGADLDLDDVHRFLAARLSPHKRPRTIEVTDAPLRDDAGKSRRSALRAQRL